MPDNTRREPRAAKEEAAKQETRQGKDITPLVCTLLERLMVKDDSPMHDVGLTMPAKGDQPEKFVTLNDLVREYKTYEDLQLLHEIAVNDEFKLTKVKNNDPLYATIEQTMHNAYWDLMRAELEQDPPQKERAISLLMDIRVAFRALLEGNNDRALRTIEDHLDPAKVREAIEVDVKAVESYTKFIIDVMGMACASARDEQIVELAKKTDLVDRLRGIMELLDLMQLDMANYVLDLARGELEKHSIEYERAKFYEQLQLAHHFSCPATEDWLRLAYRRYMCVNADTTAAGPSTAGTLDYQGMVDFAYTELFHPSTELMTPESFNLDMERLKQIRAEKLRITICAAIVYIACQGDKPLAVEFRKELAEKLMILVKDCSTVPAMKELLQSLWLHAQSTLTDRVTAEQEVALKTEILKLGDHNSQVYGFLLSKLSLYLRDVANSEDGVAAMPVAFKDYVPETVKLGKAYRKIIRQNRAVYGDFYKQVLDKLDSEH
ncbi:AGAP000633-PA-like protein [Anopheles sinensis]|uniref:AGAP000633-PA-like protein n=1 Tax=Anopheles sinensis TaxID=74873 RepID=A0A084VQ92_ANOSI|nr:AGAP000633-PA-like protein [Anopheles sinensis]